MHKFRPAAVSALVGMLLAIGACHDDKNQTERRYCDNSGCYTCVGDKCYPVPGNPAKMPPGGVSACADDSACGSGQVCNLGRCETACQQDSNCLTGDACIAGRCRPAGAVMCGVAGAFCTADAQCGTNRRCAGGGCAALCPDGKCAAGQVCQGGACIEDPAPKMAQCLFDIDCGGDQGAFRCINAYCLKSCKDSTECDSGTACLKGTCRVDRRPS